MNYAIIENESICSDLGNIADWLREKDENISLKNRKKLDKLAAKIESCSSELEAIVADHYNDKEAEPVLKKIASVLKKGFKFIPAKKRVKMLKKQKKQIEKSEKCYKTDRKQLERQFTL